MVNKVSAARKRVLFFMFLCAAVYFTSYITRINYGAVIEGILSAEGNSITKEGAGLVSTAAFFTYGVGQIISGIVGDKVKPRLLIVIGMSVTALCNIAMPLMKEAAPMMVLWGVNGLSQAMFWPPMVRMMADNLSENDYNRACIWVSVAASAATIVIYLLAAFCTAFFSWHTLFYICSLAAVVMALIWQIFAPREDIAVSHGSDREDAAEKGADKPRVGTAIVLMMIPIAFAIVLQGILRDGITTWLPTLVSETFGLPSELSILSGIILPVFSMISYNVSSCIEKKIGNELITSMIFFVTASISAAVLALTLNVNAIIAIFLMAVMTGCMHGINLMLISRVPRYFDRYGKISTISGIVNAFTYVGSALSTYLFAAISESASWSFAVLSWVIIAGIGAAVCAIVITNWRKFRNNR